MDKKVTDEQSILDRWAVDSEDDEPIRIKKTSIDFKENKDKPSDSKEST